MNIKPHTITIIATLLLTSCKQLPTTSTEVEHHSLLRSMTYTHRHLLEFKLGNAPKQNEDRQHLLVSSHCDLIDRRMVYVANNPPSCPVLTNTEQACIASFHRCIGIYPTFKKECLSCEAQATQCLDNASLNQS